MTQRVHAPEALRAHATEITSAILGPVEILLFERRENRKERQHLLMLSNAKVEFAEEAGD